MARRMQAYQAYKGSMRMDQTLEQLRTKRSAVAKAIADLEAIASGLKGETYHTYILTALNNLDLAMDHIERLMRAQP